MKLKTIVIILGISFFLISLTYAGEISWSGSEDTSFNVGNRPICYNENSAPYWLENGIQNNSALDCKREEGINVYGADTKFCCPMGYSCDINPDDINKWACFEKKSEEEIDPNLMDVVSCSNFTTYLACKMYGSPTNLPEKIKIFIQEKHKDSIRDYINDVMGTTDYNPSLDFCDNSKGPYEVKNKDKTKCLKLTNCRCEWDGITQKCVDTYTRNDKCPGTDITYIENELSCQTTEANVKNYCDDENEDNRKIVRSWTAKLVDKSGNEVTDKTDSECKSGSMDYPCPAKKPTSMASAVPFIGFFGLIGVIAIIITLYLTKKNRKN
ncbi:MAG TPA: hypothetical protein P5277_04750 [Candidatus Paceibacterota bacterium]|nr:hypothetical protein [Candidatus Paceibacterota bacterium]